MDMSVLETQLAEIPNVSITEIGMEEVEKVANVGPRKVLKALMLTDTSREAPPESGQLPPDDGTAFSSIDILEPPFNPAVWALSGEHNTRLMRAVKAWARNTVGLGWRIVPKDPEGNTIELSKLDAAQLEKFDEERRLLHSLFQFPNNEIPFTRLMFLVKYDEEFTGNGYLEVVRNNLGQIAGLYHVPSHTVRVRKGGKGFVQIRNLSISTSTSNILTVEGGKPDKRYFKAFGDPSVVNRETGERSNGRLGISKRATEIIHFKLYTSRSAHYGAPRFISTAPSIAGNRIAAERNVNFFENDAPQPLDAKVLTPTGWTTMGEMQIGSQVIGSDGRPHVVTQVLPQGEQEVYRVEFADGSSTECTLEHKWQVTNSYDRKRGVSRLMSLAEIIEDGFFYDCGTAKWSAPLVDPVVFAPAPPLPIDPYLFGYLLGNGCFRGHGLTFACNSVDAEELEAFVSAALPEGVALTKRDRAPKKAFEFRFGNTNPHHTKINKMREIAKGTGLWDRTAHDKFIPEVYLRASVEDRISLLQGLVDSDGHVGETAVRYVTVSEALANGVAELVSSLGGICTIRPMKNRTTLQLTIRQLPEHIVPARLSRKANAYAPADTPRMRTFAGASLVRRVETQCISVDVPDNLYVTDQYILTHNCPRGIIFVTGGKLDGASVKRIENFIRAKSQGPQNSGRLLVLQLEPKRTALGDESTASMHFQPVTVGVTEDASFLAYRRENDEEIREAFELAEAYFRTDTVNRSSAEIGRMATEEGAFEPDRLEKEYFLNHTIVADPGWRSTDGNPWPNQTDGPAMEIARLEFRRPTISDPNEKAKIHSLYAAAGALTPNDMRREIGKEPFPSEFEFGDKPIVWALAELAAGQVMFNGQEVPAGLKPADLQIAGLEAKASAASEGGGSTTKAVGEYVSAYQAQILKLIDEVRQDLNEYTRSNPTGSKPSVGAPRSGALGFHY
jgi:capsid portal protein